MVSLHLKGNRTLAAYRTASCLLGWIPPDFVHPPVYSDNHCGLPRAITNLQAQRCISPYIGAGTNFPAGCLPAQQCVVMTPMYNREQSALVRG